MTALLRPDAIRTNGGTQMRVRLDNSVVREYADLIAAGVELPPVVVFHDGANYWLADGFHRVNAHRVAQVELAADIRAGTREDAIAFAIQTDNTHGLRRTNADKRVAVRAALDHPVLSGWSNVLIADAVGVDRRMVDRMRDGQPGIVPGSFEAPKNTRKATGTKKAKTTGRDGKKRRQPRAPNPDVAAADAAKRKAAAEKKRAQRANNNRSHECPNCGHRFKA